MKPSEFHKNRQRHNWLVYDIGDIWIEKFSNLYRGKLVDLGCGEAPYRDYFLQYADEYIGVDWTNSLHNTNIDIVSNLNKKIELDDEFADTLISFSVMEHLSEPQIFLNEAYRVLKRDGYFIISVPWQWRIHEAPYDFYRYTPYGLKYMLEKAGFKVISIYATSGAFTTIIMKINYFSTRLIKGNKIRRKLTKLFLLPFWYISQKIAPYLDKLDKDWKLESQSYFVIAQK